MKKTGPNEQKLNGWTHKIVEVEGDDTAVRRAFEKLIEWSIQDAKINENESKSH